MIRKELQWHCAVSSIRSPPMLVYAPLWPIFAAAVESLRTERRVKSISRLRHRARPFPADIRGNDMTIAVSSDFDPREPRLKILGRAALCNLKRLTATLTMYLVACCI